MRSNFVPLEHVATYKCKKARKIAGLETLLLAIADRVDALEKEVLQLKCETTGQCSDLQEYKEHKVRDAVMSYLGEIKDEEEH